MNDKFTLPPSPKIETSPADSIPEGSRGIQRNAIGVEGNTNASANSSTSPSLASLPASPRPVHKGSVENQTEEISAEEKELAEVKTQYKLTPKFTAWIKCFTDPKEKATYGNKTQSAIKAYSLDPVKDYAVAGSMGYQNFKKLQSVASIFAEQKGYTFDKMMDAAWLKFLKSEDPAWFDRLADWFGVRDLKPTTLIDARSQTNIINVPEGEKKTFNDQFRDFVKSS